MACKVELRDLPMNPSWYEKEIAFKKMFTAFKKQVAEAGILHDFKKREYYETPGQIRRRKSREAENVRLKEKLRENFPERRKPKKSDNKKTKAKGE
jgi:ribosomal protein S21